MWSPSPCNTQYLIFERHFTYAGDYNDGNHSTKPIIGMFACWFQISFNRDSFYGNRCLYVHTSASITRGESKNFLSPDRFE